MGLGGVQLAHFTRGLNRRRSRCNNSLWVSLSALEGDASPVPNDTMYRTLFFYPLRFIEPNIKPEITA